MVGCDLHGVLKFSQVVGLFLGTSHFDLEGGHKYPPVGICGGRIPPWNFKYL